MKINKEQIKKLIPHRHPFLFVDKCEVIEVGKKGIGYKKFLPDEYFFEGHFLNNPIVPGVILVESLAQTAGIVVAKGFKDNSEQSVLFTTISNAKFRKPVLPNDNIIFEVSYLNNVRNVYKFYGQAKKENTVMCESTFSAMIISNL